jgi:hypothetical protein
MKTKKEDKQSEVTQNNSNFDEIRSRIKPLENPKPIKDKFPKEQFEAIKNLPVLKK